MTTIKEKIDSRLNDTFTENLRKYLHGIFPDVNFESHLNIFDMRLHTTWDSEDPQICAEIKKIAAAYESAYLKAREEARKA